MHDVELNNVKCSFKYIMLIVEIGNYMSHLVVDLR